MPRNQGGFSGKQKKEQLKAKRAQRRERGSGSSDDEGAASAAAGGGGGPGGISESLLTASLGRSGANNKWSTVFAREADETVMQRRNASADPLNTEARGAPMVAKPQPRLDPVLDHPKGVLLRRGRFSRESYESGGGREEEEPAFAAWLQAIYSRYRREELNYFEHSLEVWSQLWHTLATADVICIVSDVRNPLWHIPASLYTQVVYEVRKPLVIILNKVDLVPRACVEAWLGYLRATYGREADEAGSRVVVVPFSSAGDDLEGVTQLAPRRRFIREVKKIKDAEHMRRRAGCVRAVLEAAGAPEAATASVLAALAAAATEKGKAKDKTIGVGLGAADLAAAAVATGLVSGGGEDEGNGRVAGARFPTPAPGRGGADSDDSDDTASDGGSDSDSDSDSDGMTAAFLAMAARKGRSGGKASKTPAVAKEEKEDEDDDDEEEEEEDTSKFTGRPRRYKRGAATEELAEIIGAGAGRGGGGRGRGKKGGKGTGSSRGGGGGAAGSEEGKGKATVSFAAPTSDAAAAAEVDSDGEAVVTPTPLPSSSSTPLLTIGMVGYPNAGKSSVINAVAGEKRVSVSRTAGHTKRCQTVPLAPGLHLLDCPGLVFPHALVPPPEARAGISADEIAAGALAERAMQELLGVIPIAQVREPYTAVQYLAERLPVERMYGLHLPKDEEEWSSLVLCEALAEKRGYHVAKVGRPDAHAAGREILYDAQDGVLPMWWWPPPVAVGAGAGGAGSA